MSTESKILLPGDYHEQENNHVTPFDRVVWTDLDRSKRLINQENFLQPMTEEDFDEIVLYTPEHKLFFQKALGVFKHVAESGYVTFPPKYDATSIADALNKHLLPQTGLRMNLASSDTETTARISKVKDVDPKLLTRLMQVRTQRILKSLEPPFHAISYLSEKGIQLHLEGKGKKSDPILLQTGYDGQTTFPSHQARLIQLLLEDPISRHSKIRAAFGQYGKRSYPAFSDYVNALINSANKALVPWRLSVDSNDDTVFLKRDHSTKLLPTNWNIDPNEVNFPQAGRQRRRGPSHAKNQI